MTEGRDGFVLYNEHKKIFQKLSATEVKQVLMAAFDYSESGEEPDRLTDKGELVWLMVKGGIDKAKDRYARKCEQNRENGLKGGRPPKTEDNRTVFSKTEKTEQTPLKPPYELNLTELNSKRESIERKEAFEAPSLAQVKTVCQSLGFDESVATRFFNFYSANGWMQGKDKPIINWLAQLNVWVERERLFPAASASGAGAYRERSYTEEDLNKAFDQSSGDVDF